MPSKGSVTRLLAPVQAGDPAAVQQLWQRYFERLVGLARKKLQGARPAGGDEQDVALSALASFCRNAERGRFPQLAEDYRRLLDSLGDRELELVAVWRMEGLRVAEIAARLGYVTRSIKRKLRNIRAIWEQEGIR